MNQYMLMFSLGPIQPFIERARKTRDLWSGSFLLARLMEAAMENIDKVAERFVFPTYRKVDDKNANLPNRYVAIFSTLERAENSAKLSTQQVEDCWNAIRTDVWNEIVRDYATEETAEIWKQSDPDNCFEIRWVIVEGNPNNYRQWLKRIDDAFDARKRLHDFQQREEPGEKSTISGERQALRGALHGNESERKQVQAFWQSLTNKKSLSAKEISLDGSERLDAIDTIKRFATKSRLIPKQPYPSTSSVATASFVEGLLSVDPAKLQAWRDATRGPLVEIPTGATNAIPYLAQKAGENNWILQRDGDCYFRETFSPRRLEKDYGITSADEANRVAIEGKRGLEKLLEATDEKALRHPTPYFAAIKMDGDHMGELLNKVNSQDEHERISEALSDFTRTIVPPLLHEQYPGRLVYAGGDDVLALAPLARNLTEEGKGQPGTITNVINLANRLQRQYCERLQKSVVEEQQQRVTASTSIAIAHHFAPLSFVLRAMRDAERRLAKERYGRNALVVTVIRRSGAQTQVGCHWQYKGLVDIPKAQPIDLFSHFYDLFDQDVLSPKCVHILLEEAPTLVWLESEAQISEIRRVLQRQRISEKKSELSDGEIGDLASHLILLAEAMDIEHDYKDESRNKSTELDVDKPRYGLIEVLGWLLVMVFLARKEED